jgi:tRNA pseudouridine55 synthase
MQSWKNLRESASDAVVLIDKERGRTSFDTVGDVRRMLGCSKAGHSGTLDKAASGLLVICTGRATKLTRYFLEGDKRYTGIVRLGAVTDTCDGEGTIIESRGLDGLDEVKVAEIETRFAGRQLQRPPVYSALKIHGKRASDLARMGKTVELRERSIEIKSLSITDRNLPDSTITIDVSCSKGTYIRSLARDIGEFLGCGAYLQDLRRTRSGGFSVADALTPGELRVCLEGEQTGRKFVLTPGEALSHLGTIVIRPEALKRVLNGVPFCREDVIHLDGQPEGHYTILDEDKNLIAIADVDTDNWSVRYQNVFNT